MSRIEAIYRLGVFEPLEPVNLREEQRVQLSFEPTNGQTPQGLAQPGAGDAGRHRRAAGGSSR